MNNRVKEIRQSKTHKNNTLEKFGAPLGLKKSALSLIESGKNALTEQNIKAICREYNVNEDWLRYGTGEMFVDKSLEQELIDFAADLLIGENAEFKKRLITGLAKMSDEQWEMLGSVIDAISQQKKE